MPSPRANMGAATMDGKIYVAGGHGALADLRTLELYDPATNSWASLPPMAAARSRLMVAASGGKLYAMGGQLRTVDYVMSSVEVYRPTAQTWTAGLPMPVARAGGSAVVWSGAIHVVDGASGQDMAADHVAFDPLAARWTSYAGMDHPRQDPASIGTANAILVIGGALPDGTPTDQVQVYSATGP